MCGKSSCSSVALSSRKSSKTISRTLCGRAFSRSILLMTTTGLRPFSIALRRTNFVWACGPSYASTTSSTPSTIFMMRSTSPPKSAWPGVSTILIWYLSHLSEAFLARMVIPFSFSRSIESMTRSSSFSWAWKVPDCRSSWSTRVVLPWSTWAMIATLRMFSMRVPKRRADYAGGDARCQWRWIGLEVDRAVPARYSGRKNRDGTSRST